MSGPESELDEQAIAVEFVPRQWQFLCTQVHGDGDPFMADAEIEDGTVVCTKCKTTERIADMNPGCKISEDGTITTWVSPKRFSHFRR